jgi:hypothetical protein
MTCYYSTLGHNVMKSLYTAVGKSTFTVVCKKKRYVGYDYYNS